MSFPEDRPHFRFVLFVCRKLLLLLHNKIRFPRLMEILHQTVVQIIQSGTVAEMDLRNVNVTIASVEVSILRHFGREGALDVGDAVLQLKI